MSNLTSDELAELTTMFDDAQTHPLIYRGMSKSPFSALRHSFGGTINGKSYLYRPDADELIRDDALKALGKIRMARKQEALEALARNTEQFGLEY